MEDYTGAFPSMESWQEELANQRALSGRADRECQEYFAIKSLEEEGMRRYNARMEEEGRKMRLALAKVIRPLIAVFSVALTALVMTWAISCSWNAIIVGTLGWTAQKMSFLDAFILYAAFNVICVFCQWYFSD